MRAAQYFGIRDVRVVDVPEPVAKDNEAIVSIAWGGICGSDLHEYEEGPISIPTTKSPHPITNETLPITLGHEFSGTIKSAPPNSPFKPGQAVVADPRYICQNCVRCTTHRTNSCSSLGFKGLSGDGGGFAKEVAVNTSFLYPIPEETLPYAALIEPLTVAWHAVKVPQNPTYKGATILILGGGPIGVALTFVLRRFGAGRIFISEPTKRRREQNVEIADEVFDPTSQDVASLCMERTGGVGVDFVFDAAGNLKGLADGVDAVKSRGTIVVVAVYGLKPFSVPFMSVFVKECYIVCSMVYTEGDFRETVEAFVKEEFDGIEKMVTSRIALEDIVEHGFEALVHEKEKHIKILVTPRKELLE